MWQQTHAAQSESLRRATSIPYGTALALSFYLSFIFVFPPFCHAPFLFLSVCLLPPPSVYITGLSLAWPNKDDYSEWLAAWLNGCSYRQCAGQGRATAHVLMTASHWTGSGAIQCLPLYTCPLVRGLRGLDSPSVKSRCSV